MAISQEEDIALQQAKSFFESLASEDVFSLNDIAIRRDEGRAKRILRAYARTISSQASNESIKADLKENGDSINASLYHYRDGKGREADMVIQFNDGSWALVEVKLTDLEEIDKASEELVEIANDIENKRHPKPAFLMIITAGKIALKDKNGVYLIPLGCLKN